jgi:hypothetical protein
MSEETRTVSIRPGLLVLVLIIATTGCNGPTFLMSGGKLNGETKQVPSDWAFADSYGIVQLETKPEDPYSVNVAFTVLDQRLYVNAGDTETGWVKNISENPQVRLRMDGALYELRADRVLDADEISAFGDAWTSQSMFRRDPTELEEVWIYRLVAR